MTVIRSFQYPDGSHMPLSNFYPAPITVSGTTYPTNEHFFQAMKTTDPVEHAKVASAATPGQAKRLGRTVTLRPGWDALRLEVMRRALELKFSFDTHPVLAQWLLDTGDALLIEGNTWNDRFWGTCDDQGQNWLGHLLLARRAELRST